MCKALTIYQEYSNSINNCEEIIIIPTLWMRKIRPEMLDTLPIYKV